MVTTGMIMFIIGIVGMIFSFIIGVIVLYKDSKLKNQKENIENIIKIENKLDYNGKSKTKMMITENMASDEKK